MANEYTSCTPAASHVGMNQYIQATLQALAAAGIGVLLIAAAGEWWCLGIAAAIAAIMWLLAFCHWWLEDRLVCLGNEHASAVGMVVATEPPGDKSFPESLDTDFSINLLLPPNPPRVDQPTAQASTPYGTLISPQPSTQAEGLVFTGYKSTDIGTGVRSEVLHAEFEGAGIADFLLANQIALGIATVGLILCLAGGFWGMIAGYILAFLAFLASLIGLLFGLGDEGSPEDVGLPSIETNSTGGTGADVLGITGRWVYDSGHNNEGHGWNEIHPVRSAAKLGTWTGDWGGVQVGNTTVDVSVLIDQWNEKVVEAGSPLTVAGQEQPKHHWQIHPLIDGCDGDGDSMEPPH